MTQSSNVLILERGRPTHWGRTRLIVSLAVYGGALGAAAVLVSFLVRNAPAVYIEPSRMPLLQSVFFSGSGVVAGILINLPAIYWLGQRSRAPSNLLWWWAFGLFYGLFGSVLAGAFFPFSIQLMELARGTVGLGELLFRMWYVFALIPTSAINNGARDMVTWLLAGGLFGTGAWIIDMANASRRPDIYTYGPWVVSITLGLIFVSIAAYGPADALSTFG